nr:unnamed protein product [Callosobruchus chinensis]
MAFAHTGKGSHDSFQGETADVTFRRHQWRHPSKRHTVIWSLAFLQLMSAADQYGDDPGLYVTLNEPKNSTIKGHYLTSSLGRKYYAFQDVPFAMPPLARDDLRSHNHLSHGKVSTMPQKVQDRVHNKWPTCQCLNPRNTTKRLPVFFWIHGGAFIVGSGGYGMQNPSYFMDEEVVVVTTNYRLGILGFLTTEDSVIPANIGLRDQRFALEWTYANIDKFGGDPEDIVIGGESAGAGSVGYQLLGIHEKPIYTGAFLASGSSMSTWTYQQKPKQRAFKVARKLDKNFDSTDSASILALLQNVTSESLLRTCSEEEGYVNWIAVLPNDKHGYNPPTDAIENGNFVQVPVLLGFNSEESLCPIHLGNSTGDFWGLAQKVDDDPSQIMGAMDVGHQNATQIGIGLRKLYTNGLFADDIPALVRYVSDYNFITATTKHAKSASQFIPTYLYEFSFKSSTAKNSTVPGINGTCHGEDLRFYWKNFLVKIPEKEQIIARRFVRIISNFVKHKNPMPHPDPLFGNATWPMVRPNEIKYMNFGEHFKLETNPRNFANIEAFLDKHLTKPIYGHHLRSSLGRRYYAFQDVPFAMPPLGKRRFKEPQPVQPWKGVYNATKSTKLCTQKLANKMIGEEDCLYLNIYTPVNPRNTTKRLPVFFWIHGGAFLVGSGGYDMQNPSYFMDEEVVVVTTNYRLGILGFLTTEDSVIPANLGLRDQRFALEWTYANIDRFGGDPENIVIGGESAGAGSVGYHLLGIHEKPIFTGAFLASGSSMSTWTYQENPKEIAFKVARKLDKNFDSTDSASIWRYSKMSPVNLCCKPGAKKKVTKPMIFGELAKEVDDDPSQMMGVMDIGRQNATQIGIGLGKLYTNGLFADDIPAFVRYKSDYHFITASIKHAKGASQFIPTYLYEFSFKSSTAKNSTVPGINGTCHGEDLRFYWKNLLVKIPEKEQIVARRFVRIISNFVKHKNPMPHPDPLFENAPWPMVQPNEIKYMNFGEQFRLERNPRNFSNLEAFLDKHLIKPIYVY